MSEKKSVLEVFTRLIELSITDDDNGIYPHQMVMGKSDGHDIAALALNPEQAMKAFILQCIKDSTYHTVIMGLDRYTLPEQGNEFDSVVTVFIFERDMTSPVFNVRDQFKFGVINYRVDPRTIRALDYENAYWNKRMAEELFAFLPSLRLTRKVNADSSRIH